MSDSDFSGDEGVSSLAGSPMKPISPQTVKSSSFKPPYPVAQTPCEYLLLRDKVLLLEQQLATERENTLMAHKELAICKSTIKDLQHELSQYENVSDLPSPMECSTMDLVPHMKMISVGKRMHSPTGSTPYPARKVLKSIHLYHEPNSTHYNIKTKLFVMKCLCYGISYRQIEKLMEDINQLLPLESNLLIKSTPVISTIQRFFTTFSMLVKLHTVEQFQAEGDLMGSVDESPDPKGNPIMVSVVRNLKNGENIVTGVQRMAAKRAVDYYRNEKNILTVLHAACGDSAFDFKKDFVDRLKMRGGDGAATECLYHKLLGTTKNKQADVEVEDDEEDQELVQKLNEAGHFSKIYLSNRKFCVSKNENCIANTSLVFELIRVLAH